MGGGDLNLKKSWHPATLKNQERVWKEERKHAEEIRKLEQLKKELAEERQLQELQRLQEESGAKKRSDRLDWMYAAPNQGGPAPGSSEMEDYLLGKRNVDTLLRDKNSKETIASSANERFAIANSNANTERDIQSKIREDPLLMIKKQEQEALKAIFNNPLRLKELQKKEKHKKHKKEKKEKKEKKREFSKERDRDRHDRDRYDRDRYDRDRYDRDRHQERHKRRSSESPDSHRSRHKISKTSR